MKSKSKERIGKLLDSANLKKTLPRKMVLEVLMNSKKPKTADEIYIEIGNQKPNRVTIYRILESMVEAGIVHRAFIADGSQHFELADKCTKHQCHPHFVCTGCGKTSCLHDASVSLAKNMPEGFIIQRQQIRLEGLCPKCA